jgi:hypothetical protein
MTLSRSLLTFLLFTTPAAAQAPNDAARQTAVNIATDWLTQNTTYKKIPPVRVWVPLSAEKMAAQANRGGVPTGDRQAAAIYSCGADTMYFNEGMSYTDVAFLSVMVHELTHSAQCKTGAIGKRDLCSIEREAYTNQQNFLRALPDRLARAGAPLSPPAVAAVNKEAASIDKIVAGVCAVGKR